MVAKKKAINGPSDGKKRKGNDLLWGLLILVLKVLGIAFIVQGFGIQFTSGVLYFGLVHYTIGVLLGVTAWHLHKQKCVACTR